jgi:hypothetical protein
MVKQRAFSGWTMMIRMTTMTRMDAPGNSSKLPSEASYLLSFRICQNTIIAKPINANNVGTSQINISTTPIPPNISASSHR